MLNIGLTGGIGAGKSTVSQVFADLGAVIVDADAAARQAVAPGSAGLAAVTREFGPDVLAEDGALDRAAMARLVFGDGQARGRLEAIVHPLVREATEKRVAGLPADAVVVHDVPLIVEKDLGPDYHLVTVVGASAEERVQRLLRDRGMAQDEARARITAQADDDARRAVADVWIDNTGDRDAVRDQAARLWDERLLPFARNLADRTVAPRAVPLLVDPTDDDPAWALQADRLLARLRRAGGTLVVAAEHIGSTAVSGLPAKDVLDLQIGVASLADADELGRLLADAGFPALAGTWIDTPKPYAPDPGRWAKRLHGNADPARAVNLHVREVGGPAWWYAVTFRDWLRADGDARSDYLAAKRAAAATPARYAEAKEPWFTQAWPRLEAWVRAHGRHWGG